MPGTAPWHAAGPKQFHNREGSYGGLRAAAPRDPPPVVVGHPRMHRASLAAVCEWRGSGFWLPCSGRADAYRYDVAIVILLMLYGGGVAPQQLQG